MGKSAKMKSPTKKETTKLPLEIRAISERMRVIRFNNVFEKKDDPWEKISGVVKTDKIVDIEGILDAKGFEEAEIHLQL